MLKQCLLKAAARINRAPPNKFDFPNQCPHKRLLYRRNRRIPVHECSAFRHMVEQEWRAKRNVDRRKVFPKPFHRMGKEAVEIFPTRPEVFLGRNALLGHQIHANIVGCRIDWLAFAMKGNLKTPLAEKISDQKLRKRTGRAHPIIELRQKNPPVPDWIERQQALSVLDERNGGLRRRSRPFGVLGETDQAGAIVFGRWAPAGVVQVHGRLECENTQDCLIKAFLRQGAVFKACLQVPEVFVEIVREKAGYRSRPRCKAARVRYEAHGH